MDEPIVVFAGSPTAAERSRRGRMLSALTGLFIRQHPWGYRPTADELLTWARSLSDDDLLVFRNVGPATVAWIRDDG